MFHIDYGRIVVQRIPKGIIASYPFSVGSVEFTCNLVELSCELPDITDIAQDLIENEQIIEKAEGTFWMDFDAIQNQRQKTPYKQLSDTGFGFKHWIYLSDALCEIIAFHQEQYDCEFYFAEPANDRLASAYERLIVPKLVKDGYNYYIDDSDDGGWYVFSKN